MKINNILNEIYDFLNNYSCNVTVEFEAATEYFLDYYVIKGDIRESDINGNYVTASDINEFLFKLEKKYETCFDWDIEAKVLYEEEVTFLKWKERKELEEGYLEDSLERD